jgi:hypothetical protein
MDNRTFVPVFATPYAPTLIPHAPNFVRPRHPAGPALVLPHNHKSETPPAGDFRQESAPVGQVTPVGVTISRSPLADADKPDMIVLARRTETGEPAEHGMKREKTGSI